jgi:hypothetical protein
VDIYQEPAEELSRLPEIVLLHPYRTYLYHTIIKSHFPISASIVYNTRMPKEKNSDEAKGHWQELAQSTPAAQAMPTQLTVRITNGAWFGIAMGIGFAIGFLISLLCLIAFVGFVIHSKYPGWLG